MRKESYEKVGGRDNQEEADGGHSQYALGVLRGLREPQSAKKHILRNGALGNKRIPKAGNKKLFLDE